MQAAVMRPALFLCPQYLPSVLCRRAALPSQFAAILHLLMFPRARPQKNFPLFSAFSLKFPLPFRNLFLNLQSTEGNGQRRGATRERMSEGTAVLLGRATVKNLAAFFFDLKM